MEKIKTGRPVAKRRWLPKRLVRARIALEWPRREVSERLTSTLRVRVSASVIEKWETRKNRAPEEMIRALEQLYSAGS